MVASLITASLRNADLEPIDEVRFSWAVNIGAITAGQAQTFIHDWFEVETFGSIGANQKALASCMVPATDPSGVEIRVYDISTHLDGSRHGSPYLITSHTLSEVGGDSRGNQLCALLHYETADYGTTPVDGPVGDIPSTDSAIDQGAPPTHLGVTKLQSRKGGRMYWGPLDASVIGADGNGNPEFTATWRANFTGNLKGFATSHPEWCVWSRRNAALVPVHSGWIENSPVTSRSKQFRGSGRTAWTL